MTTKSKKPENILLSINSLFEDISEKDIIENEAKLIMFRFLDIVDRKKDEMGWSRKQMAQELGTSASYITQLYRGDKLVNLTFLARIQKVFGIKFEVSELKSYQEETISKQGYLWSDRIEYRNRNKII